MGAVSPGEEGSILLEVIQFEREVGSQIKSRMAGVRTKMGFGIAYGPEMSGWIYLFGRGNFAIQPRAYRVTIVGLVGPVIWSSSFM